MKKNSFDALPSPRFRLMRDLQSLLETQTDLRLDSVTLRPEGSDFVYKSLFLNIVVAPNGKHVYDVEVGYTWATNQVRIEVQEIGKLLSALEALHIALQTLKTLEVSIRDKNYY
jgi:hypothetical protein